MSESKTTSLYDFHLSKNAKIIDFAGWSMPFSYDGTLKEHHYVRESAGYFDVSHMGRLRLNYSQICLLYTSPSPRDLSTSRMPSSA